MPGDRTFYGGESVIGADNISGGIYSGPGLGDGPWKCPACAVENTGLIADGCQACGSGSAKARKVGLPPTPAPSTVPIDQRQRATPDAYAMAEAWATAHPDASLAEAFAAGYLTATGQTVQAPPVTADVATLAPEGKARRTIVAALHYFREQVLPMAHEEVASGEWCSIEEADQLIHQMETEEKASRP